MPKHVLLIDDEVHFLMAMTARFKAQGYKVSAARDGQAGLAIASANRLDAVICDINLPECDGFQIIQKLRQIPTCETVPVVFLSANVKSKGQMQEEEASYFLSKPCEARKLLDLLESAMTRHTGNPLGKHAEASLS